MGFVFFSLYRRKKQNTFSNSTHDCYPSIQLCCCNTILFHTAHNRKPRKKNLPSFLFCKGHCFFSLLIFVLLPWLSGLWRKKVCFFFVCFNVRSGVCTWWFSKQCPEWLRSAPAAMPQPEWETDVEIWGGICPSLWRSQSLAEYYLLQNHSSLQIIGLLVTKC